jgi:hypothetical protein
MLGLIILLGIQALPIAPTHAQSRGRALIMSSLEQYIPMGRHSSIQKYLESAGYSVTFLADSFVTLSVLTNQLDEYDIVVWRTNAYEWNHVTYWYVGVMDNQVIRETYSTDFQKGWVDYSDGILGVSMDFFLHHYDSWSLANIKLAILISSNSAFLGNAFLGAGVKAIVDYTEPISLSFSIIDYVSTMVVRYLSSGISVQDSVLNVLTVFLTARHEDPLDPYYMPPLMWMGNGALTIA